MSCCAGSLNTGVSRPVMKEAEAWLAFFPCCIYMLDMPTLVVFATVPLSVCLSDSSHVPSKAQDFAYSTEEEHQRSTPVSFLMPPVCVCLIVTPKGRPCDRSLGPRKMAGRKKREERDALHCAGIHTALRWPSHRKRLFALATQLHRDGTDPMCRTGSLLKHFPLVGF